jgi:AraC-like DNA-binding protein
MARGEGLMMSDFSSRITLDESVDESHAWLEFVGACHGAVERLERGSSDAHETPKLIAAATRLQTQTARVLALSMINRVTNRLAAGPAAAQAPVVTPETVPPQIQPSSRVTAVLAYITEAHSRPSCRLEEIAAQLRVSRSYLSRVVLRETGLSYNKHLQFARMNTAARLLQSTHLSVKEISSSTGYQHVPSFDRQFRNHFKMTPGEFRKGIRV